MSRRILSPPARCVSLRGGIARLTGAQLLEACRLSVEDCLSRLAAREKGLSEEEAFAAAGKMAPLGQVLVPEEVAGLVAWLAMEDARNVTGQSIVIDGGQVMP